MNESLQEQTGIGGQSSGPASAELARRFNSVSSHSNKTGQCQTSVRKRRPKGSVNDWQIFGEIAVADIGKGCVVLVDLDDLPRVENHLWYATTNNQDFYAVTGRLTYMHRLLLGLDKGDTRRGEHRSCDTLDNRSENLRIATTRQNRANTRRHKVGQSQYKGVRPCGSKWSAAIGPRDQRVYLGIFDTEELAARAVDIKAVEIYGEFWRPNFPSKL